MTAAPALDDLFAQLHALRDEVQGGDLERASVLLHRHDRDLRAFLHGEAGRGAGAEVLARLLHLQRDIQRTMTDARERVRRQMQDSQRIGRAARAYLAQAQE